MGQNPAVGAPNSRLERKALAKLKWLVVRDMVEVETASFWLDSPEVERGELQSGGNRHGSVSLSRRRLMPKKTAASRIPKDSINFTRKRSSLRETLAAKRGSCITSGAG